MSYYLILKSTIEQIVEKLRGRDSSIGTMTGGQISDYINNLEMVQSISPSVTLNKSTTSYTIPKGRNTSGTVSVNTQSKTVSPGNSSQVVTADDGKVLTSVTVEAMNDHPFECGTISPTKNSETITINGLGFRPVGLAINFTGSESGSKTNGAVTSLYTTGSVTNGRAESTSSSYGMSITSASITSTSTSITVSGISASGTSCKFKHIEYTYAVWG